MVVDRYAKTLPARVRYVLRDIPMCYRDDATSEAILAYLDGQSEADVVRTIHRFVKSEQRHEAREPTLARLGVDRVEDIAIASGLEYDEYHGYRLSDS